MPLLILLALALILAYLYHRSWGDRPSRFEFWQWFGTFLLVSSMILFALWLYGYGQFIGWLLYGLPTS